MEKYNTGVNTDIQPVTNWQHPTSWDKSTPAVTTRSFIFPLSSLIIYYSKCGYLQSQQPYSLQWQFDQDEAVVW